MEGERAAKWRLGAGGISEAAFESAQAAQNTAKKRECGERHAFRLFGLFGARRPASEETDPVLTRLVLACFPTVRERSGGFGVGSFSICDLLLRLQLREIFCNLLLTRSPVLCRF